jgi:ribosome-associated toxin RatA of RatAB toxin-antitoxin module
MTAAILLALMAAPMPGAVRWMGFDDADWETLGRDQVVSRVDSRTSSDGHLRSHSDSAVIIHRPLADCFSEVERYQGLSDYLPGMAEARVLERSERGFRAHAATRVLWLKFGYGLDFEVDRARGEIRWKLDHSQPADIVETQGKWQFVALDEHTTLLHYVVDVESGSVVPQAIQNLLTRRTLPGVLTAFRDHLQATTG